MAREKTLLRLKLRKTGSSSPMQAALFYTSEILDGVALIVRVFMIIKWRGFLAWSQERLFREICAGIKYSSPADRQHSAKTFAN